MSANTLPHNCEPCDACNGSGNACGYHVVDDATQPQYCATCNGHGYIEGRVVEVHSSGDTVPADWEDWLLQARDILWDIRNFKPGAMECRVHICDMLTVVQDAKERER